LPEISLRPSSYSKAEELLAQGLADRDKIIFRPLHVWTEQDTTEELLEKKQIARDRYGWEVDFEDFKLPFLKNIETKMRKLETN
jgi:hypothetical protein